MMKKVLISIGLISMLAVPALAEGATCSAMIEKLDALTQGAKLDEAAKKVVADMRARAEDQMKAGDEEGCKATAGEAIKALSGE